MSALAVTALLAGCGDKAGDNTHASKSNRELTRESTSDGSWTEYEYDVSGNLIREANIEFEYDESGKLVR